VRIPLPPSADGFDENGNADEPEETEETGKSKHPFPAVDESEAGDESEKSDAGNLGESDGGFAFEAEELSNGRG
jgi:hypothetical protein